MHTLARRGTALFEPHASSSRGDVAAEPPEPTPPLSGEVGRCGDEREGRGEPLPVTGLALPLRRPPVSDRRDAPDWLFLELLRL